MKLERQMNLLKKTLLATAVAAISTGALAADVSTSTVSTIGAESVAVGAFDNDGTEYVMGTVTITSGQNWSKDDTIEIKLDGATFPEGSAFALDNAAIATFAVLSSTADSVIFRVSQVETGQATETESFNLTVSDPSATLPNNAIILNDGLTLGSEVTVTATVKTSAGQIIDVSPDAANEVAPVAELIAQYAVTSTPGTAEAQLANNFESLAADLVMGTTIVETTPNTGVFVPTEQKLILAGSLAAFDNSGANQGTVAQVNGAAGAGTVTIADDKMSASIIAADPADLASTVTLASAASADADTVAIDPANYNISYELKDANGKVVALSSNAKYDGSISLDSPSVAIPYLPVGDAVTPFVWVTNSGSVAGDIHVTAMTVNGTEYDLGVVGSAKSGLTKVDAAIVQGLKDAGVNTQYETVKLRLSVNRTPGDDIAVYAAYKHVGDADRLQVPVYPADAADNTDQ
jgi:hypothetical protein